MSNLKSEKVETTSTAKTIHESIVDVMRDLEPIAKDRRNTQQGYSFRGIDDAMNAFAPLFAKHGIYTVIENIEVLRFEEVTSKQGAKGYHAVVAFALCVRGMLGDFVSYQTIGEAIDYGDKVVNKAMSIGYREALFKMFVVPFENDDTENHDHEIATTRNNAPIEKVSPDKVSRPATVSQLNLIAKLVGELGLPPIETTGMPMTEASKIISALIEKQQAMKIDAPPF